MSNKEELDLLKKEKLDRLYNEMASAMARYYAYSEVYYTPSGIKLTKPTENTVLERFVGDDDLQRQVAYEMEQEFRDLKRDSE